MASNGFKGSIGALIGGSMMFGSTAAMASMPAPVQRIDPWAALATMSGGAPAASMCGAAAAAAAAASDQVPSGCVLPVLDAAPLPVAPPSPPAFVPIPVAGALTGEGLLMIALAAIVAAGGIYYALHDTGSRPNSPA